MIKLYTLCLALLLLASCAEPTKEETAAKTISSPALIENPQPKRDYTNKFQDERQHFRFRTAEEQKIQLPSGTAIRVPANCFVDANGKSVKGEVNLVFEEFITPGSIITSGINMKYDSADIVRDFESAGMFRIGAFKGQEAVFIAKDKSIEVAQATIDDASNFRTYYSTKNGDDWKDIGKSPLVKNENRQNKMQAVSDQLSSTVKPAKPTEWTSSGKYFDLNLNGAASYDLKKLLAVVWQYAGSDPKNDPAVNTRVYNRQWDDVNILPDEGGSLGVYSIVLRNRDTVVYTKARPVFRGKVLDEANEEFAAELGEYNQRMKQIKNEQKQAVAEAEFLRVLQVKQLGLYNYDRNYHMPEMTPVLADFDFGNDSLKNYPISVYLVTGNGLAVIKYPPHDWNKFAYCRKDVNKMIAILPNQEICTFSAKRFAKEGPAFPENKPGKFEFVLNHSGVKANNSKAIDQVLANI